MYAGFLAVLLLYLVSIFLGWEFYYFLFLFCAIVFTVSLVRFEVGFLFVLLTLANPYLLKETGTHLHLSELVLIIIFVVFLGRVFILREKIDFPREFLVPATILILISVISLAVARYYLAGIQQLVRYVEILLAFFAVVLYTSRTERNVYRMFIALIIGGGIASIVGISQFVTNAIELRQTTRVFGWLGGGYGALIASTFILSLCALWYMRGTALKILAFVTLPVSSVALLLSQTRAWIGALLFVLFFMMLMERPGARRKILLIAGAAIGLLIVLWQTDLFGLLHNDFLAGAMQGAFRFGQSQQEHSLNDFSLFLRFNAWLKAVELFVTHPILGIGVGNVRFSSYITLKLGMPGEGVGYVDNQYLQVFAEAGAIAGIAWILYVYRAVRAGIKGVRSSTDPRLHGLAAAFLGCLLIYAVGSCFWVISPEHESFAFMILYAGLSINVCRLVHSHELKEGSQGIK